MAQIKPGGKKLLYGILIAAAVFGLWKFNSRPRTVGEAQTLAKVTLPDEPTASLQGSAAVKLPFPSTQVSNKPGLDIEWQMMMWQSQNSIIFANGGIQTTGASLMEDAGLNVKIVRQDDCNQSRDAFIKYLKDYKEGKRKDGMFVTYMGSGIDNYVNAIKNATKELGAEWGPVVFLTTGKSFGEDQLIGPKEIKENKQLLRGKVARGVKEDGDLDIAIQVCNDNKIPINGDPTLYYPDALNLSYSNTYLSAVEDYNKNLKEKRHIVVNGKTTGKDTLIGYDLVATWTPGDVNAHDPAQNGRGGATIASTLTYKSIMPNITIGSKKFVSANRDKLIDMTIALGKAGDQIRTYKEAKEYACELGAKVWGENTKAYWIKYYDGVDVKSDDAHLGGSMVYNLNDMANIFGLNNTRDIFKDIYNNFSQIHAKLYPEDYKTIANYTEIVDKSILRDALEKIKDNPNAGLLTGSALQTDYSKGTGEVVGDASYGIEFETGSAQISKASEQALLQLASKLNTSDGLSVNLYGHTDNTGNDSQNIPLSKERANSVAAFLKAQGIPEDRIKDVDGFGSTKPLHPNKDQNGAEARKENRRVQVVLKG